MHTGEFICFILFRKQNKIKKIIDIITELKEWKLNYGGGGECCATHVSEKSKAFICSIVDHASVNNIRFKLLERTDNK